MRTEPIVPAERDAFLRTQRVAVCGLILPLIVMGALGCVLIASFCWSAATAPVLGLWLSINAVAMVVRAAVAFAYRLGRLPAIGTRGWAAALIAGAAFDGLMWGAAVVWVPSTATANPGRVMMCVGLCALAIDRE